MCQETPLCSISVCKYIMTVNVLPTNTENIRKRPAPSPCMFVRTAHRSDPLNVTQTNKCIKFQSCIHITKRTSAAIDIKCGVYTMYSYL